jgi:hypothetical protein
MVPRFLASLRDDRPHPIRPPFRIRARMAARRLSWRVAGWAHRAPRLTERGIWWLAFLLCCFGFWWMTLSALFFLVTGFAP